jgi:hypothetical protein
VEGYDFEKLAREIVAGRLAGLAERAPEAAAEIAKRILVAALQSTRTRQDPAKTTESVCRGVLGGLVLINQDLAAAAPLILKEMAHVSHDVPISPEDLMTWAMDGFGRVAVLAGPEAEHAIQMAIDREFHGAGEVFGKACEKARAGGAAA